MTFILAVHSLKITLFPVRCANGWVSEITDIVSTAMHSVTLNLANKFSQCTFSVAEHYDLFSGLIILRQV